MIKAQIIADSVNGFGNRITTFVLTFPRIVLAEFNTHRMLSRNSASSRAIPFAKMLEMVKKDPFIPIRWMKEHKGMQGTEYWTEEESKDLISWWLKARDEACLNAQILNTTGVTKQVCNRLLEPFMWHTCICTGTDWENFFALRAHPEAEIHIQELAHRMLEAYNESSPKQLKPGEWHIPFGDMFDKPFFKTENFNYGLVKWIPAPEVDGEWVNEWLQNQKVMVATARCARVSYLNFEGNDDYEVDFKLYDRLLSSGHMSPFEHCAMCMDEVTYNENFMEQSIPNWFGGDDNTTVTRGVSGNLRGFIQLRKLLAGENKTDERVTKL